MAFPQPKHQPPQLPCKLLRSLDCQQGAVRAVRFNADGNYVLSCGSDKTLRLWSASRGALLKTYSGHGYEVLDADGSGDNSQLCSCSSDKTVILWDVATGQVTRKLRGHAGKVNCVRFNEEATVIISGSIDSTVRCWDTRSRRPDPIQILDEAKDGVSSLRVSQFELLTGCVDGRVRRYDLRMGELHADFIGSPITCVCFSQDGQCTLSSSLDSTLRLLDKSTGELLGEYTGHKNSAYKLDCCLSERDTHILSCSEDGHVYFWDLVEGSLSLKLPVGKAVVQSLSFHPSEPRLLTAMEGCVQIWGVESEDSEGTGV
ncbi:WD repeat domain-containing protein 83 [Amia ocellicauda]|uniref:WD repeat domain-containing protein 83 n=1 Tax=Amia ocellicauda TaxID=2972642 RepID=UPI003463D2EC